MARAWGRRALITTVTLISAGNAAIFVAGGWIEDMPVLYTISLTLLATPIVFYLDHLRPPRRDAALVTTGAGSTRITYRRDLIVLRILGYAMWLPMLVGIPIAVGVALGRSESTGSGVAVGVLLGTGSVALALALTDQVRRALVPAVIELTPDGVRATLPNEDVEVAWQGLVEVRRAHDVNGRVLYLGCIPAGLHRRPRKRFFRNTFRSVGIRPPLASVTVPLVGLPIDPDALGAALMSYARDPGARQRIGTIGSVRDLTAAASGSPVHRQATTGVSRP